jgi:hypothetical protein
MVGHASIGLRDGILSAIDHVVKPRRRASAAP